MKAIDGKLCSILFRDDIIEPDLQENSKFPIFQEVSRWLDYYFAGRNPSITDIDILLEGSDFSKLVWRRLSTIPYGCVTTYKNIAQGIACDLGRDKMSAQAVGRAIGRNPLLILIPCHRVIGSDGSLVGYSGGLENKLSLLKHEGVDVSKFSF